MARKKREEEHINQERWLVSYADFITLLFAFFVVMYAISSVNEGKYRVLSDTLNHAFTEPTRSLQPVQVGEINRSGNTVIGDKRGISLTDEPVSTIKPLPEENARKKKPKTPAPELFDQAAADELFQVAEEIRFSLKPFVDKGLVDVKHTPYWVEVDMKSSMLFPSGSARLSREALDALRAVVGILKPVPNPVHVEGYTDDVPISTRAFPSNWELSAARAASVVHFFSRQGIRPDRLAAIGYGEHRPVATNETEEGRNQNRRVSLIIMANGLQEDSPVLRPSSRRKNDLASAAVP